MESHVKQILPMERRHYPVLFVHGAFSWGSQTYQYWLPQTVKAGWEAYAVDLRGHPDSQAVKNFGGVSIMDYADDVEAVLKRIGPAYLVGHSMGGLVAQVVASRNKVPGLVLVASAAPQGISILKQGSTSLRGLWRSRREIWSMLLRRPFTPKERSIEVDGTRVEFIPESGRALRELAQGLITVDETRVACPVLAVIPLEDKTIPPEAQIQVARKYQATSLEFPGYGHALMLERNWQAPLQQILHWLETIEQ